MGMSVAQYARPAAPIPLLVVWAIVPATCVPCPWSSAASAESSTKFHPPSQRVPARSVPRENGPLSKQATPVSMIATVTPRPQV